MMATVAAARAVWVKICGLGSRQAAAAATAAGADALGFVFVPGVRRAVDPDAVAAWLTSLAPGPARVGVFADAPPEQVAAVADRLGLDMVQLAGEETPAYVAALGRRTPVRLGKVIRLRTEADLRRIGGYDGVWAFTLDAYVAGQIGGTGHTLDWELAARAHQVAPGRRIILAGGLHAGNVGAAIAAVRPFGVDVSSGVETEGMKDPVRIQAFTTAAKGGATVGEPDARGRFGPYGGRFVPETLMPALGELEAAYAAARQDPAFVAELDQTLAAFVGRPTPLYRAARLSEHAGGSRIYLKREDLNHTGSHKINNTVGQALLARRMGKRLLIAETGAGQHGVATATVAARLGLECRVYMGAKDMARQRLNVFRMRLLGAEVVPVQSGSATLKDATGEAIRAWAEAVRTAHYVIGSVVGPHPYPMLVRDLQAVIGRETIAQITDQAGRLPDAAVACVGGGSNAMGLFWPLVPHPAVRLVGVEAAGAGLTSGRHAASLLAGAPGILHGALTYVLQDADGQIRPAHSISAGLDYPGVGPGHAYLKDSGRVHYTAVTDAEALDAFQLLSRQEGIIPALESAHAVAAALRLGRELGPDSVVAVCLSGRGDKDVDAVQSLLGGDAP